MENEFNLESEELLKRLNKEVNNFFDKHYFEYSGIIKSTNLKYNDEFDLIALEIECSIYATMSIGWTLDNTLYYQKVERKFNSMKKELIELIRNYINDNPTLDFSNNNKMLVCLK